MTSGLPSKVTRPFTVVGSCWQPTSASTIAPATKHWAALPHSILFVPHAMFWTRLEVVAGRFLAVPAAGGAVRFIANRFRHESHRTIGQAKLRAARMAAAETLLFPPEVQVNLFRGKINQVVQRNVAAAPVAVGVERRG